MLEWVKGSGFKAAGEACFRHWSVALDWRCISVVTTRTNRRLSQRFELLQRSVRDTSADRRDIVSRGGVAESRHEIPESTSPKPRIYRCHIRETGLQRQISSRGDDRTSGQASHYICDCRDSGDIALHWTLICIIHQSILPDCLSMLLWVLFDAPLLTDVRPGHRGGSDLRIIQGMTAQRESTKSGKCSR
jgi:hypothetical protein